jgi:hypothetical protein
MMICLQKAQLITLQSRLREIEARRNGYQTQLGAPLMSQLSSDEQREIDAIQVSLSHRELPYAGISLVTVACRMR